MLGAYDLILNRYGPELTIGSVHIQVPDEMTAVEIDTLSRRIAAKMYAARGIIMTVGIYAANEKTPESRAIRKALNAVTDPNPEILQVHGFYVDKERKHVSFDMIVDFKCPDRERVKSDVLEKMQHEFPEYTFSTVLDADFSD